MLIFTTYSRIIGIEEGVLRQRINQKYYGRKREYYGRKQSPAFIYHDTFFGLTVPRNIDKVASSEESI